VVFAVDGGFWPIRLWMIGSSRRRYHRITREQPAGEAYVDALRKEAARGRRGEAGQLAKLAE
jgi:hypothetical protein